MSTCKELIKFQSLLLAIATVWLLGCTHTTFIVASSSCHGIDWWETGHTDGVAGGPIERLNELRARCDGTNDPVAMDLYMNGRDAGLVDYCTPAQGYAAGRNGGVYQQVCPPQLETAFLKNFESGRHVRSLEKEHAEVENRIDLLTQKLSSPRGASATLQYQLEELRVKRAQIDYELSQLENRNRKL